jgi:hypothetical protein
VKQAINDVSTVQLRRFGWLFSGFVAGLFGLLVPWLADSPSPLWPLWLSGGVFTLATIVPATLKPLYRVWMAFGAIAGWINTRIILGLIFYLVVAPLGLLMRILHKDPMSRRFQPKAKSYRVTSEIQDPSHMEKPF